MVCFHRQLYCCDLISSGHHTDVLAALRGETATGDESDGSSQKKSRNKKPQAKYRSTQHQTAMDIQHLDMVHDVMDDGNENFSTGSSDPGRDSDWDMSSSSNRSVDHDDEDDVSNRNTTSLTTITTYRGQIRFIIEKLARMIFPCLMTR